jgi:hypothetical protein
MSKPERGIRPTHSAAPASPASERRPRYDVFRSQQFRKFRKSPAGEAEKGGGRAEPAFGERDLGCGIDSWQPILSQIRAESPTQSPLRDQPGSKL